MPASLKALDPMSIPMLNGPAVERLLCLSSDPEGDGA